MATPFNSLPPSGTSTLSGSKKPLPPPISGSSTATSTDMPAFNAGYAIVQPDNNRERRHLFGLRPELLDLALKRQIRQIGDFHFNRLAKFEALEGRRRHQRTTLQNDRRCTASRLVGPAATCANDFTSTWAMVPAKGARSLLRSRL